MRFQPGAMIDGRFRVTAELGAGGMGIVYAAVDVPRARDVAVKVARVDEDTGEARIQRFVREARFLTRLRHPNIVQVFDAGLVDHRFPYIAMERLRGCDLRRQVRDCGPLDARRAVDDSIDVGNALEEAHRQGIVHRDVKPSNLFLTDSGIKLVDFGLAKATEDDPCAEPLTASNSPLGSPSYMAPEQIRAARDVNGRADVWGLGASLYFLLSGRRPFEARSMGSTLARVLTSPPHSLAQDLRVPDTVAAVIRRALRKNPAERYQTMSDMLRALREARASLDALGYEAPVPKPAPPVPTLEDTLTALSD